MSISYEFHANDAGIDRLLHAPNGPLGVWLARKGNQWVNAAKARANVDTGLMRSRIEFRVEVDAGGLVGILAAKTSYAVYVHARNPFLLDAIRSAP